VRVSLGSNTWRVFCFFEVNRLVVVLNGYVKKEDKTSAREIKKAIQLMKKYHEEKK
jgi:phage-related protein